jgi:hypothetical protein
MAKPRVKARKGLGGRHFKASLQGKRRHRVKARKVLVARQGLVSR